MSAVFHPLDQTGVGALSRALRMVVAVSLLSVASCGRSNSDDLSVAVIGSPDDPFSSGVRRPLAGQLVRAATVAGLVAFDEQGRVVPALADRWIVTDDGQSYIFRLRDGDWLDGKPITAKSAKVSLDAAIKSLRGSPTELDLAGIDEIRVMAARVIEIRLNRPVPFLLQLLAQPELGLAYEGGGGGPMILERENEVARLTPLEPSRLGMPAISEWDERTRQVLLASLPADKAVERFNGGEADLVLGGRLQDFPLTSSVGILRGTIQLDPVSGLFGLKVMNEKGFLGDPANREALSMALDREGLIAPFRLDGWTATARIVPAGLEQDSDESGGLAWMQLPLDARRANAVARVRAWSPRKASATEAGEYAARSRSGKASEQAVPASGITLSVWLPQGPGSDTLFEKISENFAAIGLTTKRAADDEDGDLRLIDQVARYPRAVWYLNRMSCQAKQGLCDKDADDLLAQANGASDAASRASLLAQAEMHLAAANVYIPIGTPVRWSLVRGSVSGFASNTWAWHPLMPLAWLPR